MYERISTTRVAGAFSPCAISGDQASTAIIATALHATGYLAVTAIVAVVVFEKFGVGLLRKAWLNLDVLWAAALLGTGVLTFLI